jgi:hypothetical protein
MKALLTGFLAIYAHLSFASAQPTNSFPAAAPELNSSVVKLGHGVNLGNMLEAPREGAWGGTIQEDYFPILRQAGFTLIRVPIRWSAHVSAAPDYKIDPAKRTTCRPSSIITTMRR